MNTPRCTGSGLGRRGAPPAPAEPYQVRGPAAGDHPDPRSRRARRWGTFLADRLYRREPERIDRRAPGGPGGDGAHPGLVPPGLAPVSSRAGLPELGEVDFALVHGRGHRPASAAEAADAHTAAILASGDRLHRPADARRAGAHKQRTGTSEPTTHEPAPPSRGHAPRAGRHDHRRGQAARPPGSAGVSRRRPRARCGPGFCAVPRRSAASPCAAPVRTRRAARRRAGRRPRSDSGRPTRCPGR